MAYDFTSNSINISSGITNPQAGCVLALDSTTAIMFGSENGDDLLAKFITYNPTEDTMSLGASWITIKANVTYKYDAEAVVINSDKILLSIIQDSPRKLTLFLLSYNKTNQTLSVLDEDGITDTVTNFKLCLINENYAWINYYNKIYLLTIDIINNTLTLGSENVPSPSTVFSYSTVINFNEDEGLMAGSDSFGFYYHYFSMNYSTGVATFGSKNTLISYTDVRDIFSVKYDIDKIILFNSRSTQNQIYGQFIENSSGTLTLGTTTKLIDALDVANSTIDILLNLDKKIVIQYNSENNYTESIKIFDYDEALDTYSLFQTIQTTAGAMYVNSISSPSESATIFSFSPNILGTATYEGLCYIHYLAPPSSGINKIFIGTTNPIVYIGNTSIKKIYIESSLVYEVI